MQRIAPDLSEHYRATPDAVATARASLAAYAHAVQASPREVDAVRLAVSEAVTNAVLHAYRGSPGSILITAGVSGRDLWVRIADDGCGLEPIPIRPGLGMGLGLITQVADDLTITPRAGGGTEVRMRFRIDALLRPVPGGRGCAGGGRASGSQSRTSMSSISVLR